MQRTHEHPADDFWHPVAERLARATAGRFEIRGKIGHGGMAAVYLAQDVALNRRVAIKVMSPALLTTPGMVERFRKEATTVANLSHPNIITIHEVSQTGDLHYFVMSFVEGRSLEAILQEVGPLSVPLVRSILADIGGALAFAHRRGVIHRDVKPANLLIDRDGRAVVTDFGIAKVAESSSHTQAGLVIGTPAYMSPEQLADAGLTTASDQYSLGVVAFEMLAGRTPFGGSTVAVIQGHFNQAVPAIRNVRPDCPPEMEAAILRLLEKDPARRWGNVLEACSAMGAAPLPEGHPVRLQLAQLAASEAPAVVEEPPRPGAPPVEEVVGEEGPAATPIPAGPQAAGRPARGRRLPVRPLTASLLIGGLAASAAAGAILWKLDGRAGEPTEALPEEVAGPPDGLRPAPIPTNPSPEAAPSTEPAAARPGVKEEGAAPAAPVEPPRKEEPRAKEAPRTARREPEEGAAAPAVSEPEPASATPEAARSVVEAFMRSLTTGSAAEVRRVYPGLGGHEPWWRYVEAHSAESVRVAYFEIHPGYPKIGENGHAQVVFDLSLSYQGNPGSPQPYVLRAVLRPAGRSWALSEVFFY